MVPVVTPRIPCSLRPSAKPPIVGGVPDPSAPIGPDGLPDRWIVTTDGVAQLGAYIVSLHHELTALKACIEESQK